MTTSERTANSVPAHWIELGACSAEEAAHRLAAGRLLTPHLPEGLTPSEWLRVGTLPPGIIRAQWQESTGKLLPTAGDALWTLVRLRPASNCAPRWYAHHSPAPQALAAVRAFWPEPNPPSLLLHVSGQGAEMTLDDPPVRLSLELLPGAAKAARDHFAQGGTRYRGRLAVGTKVLLKQPVLGAQPGAVGIVYEVYDRGGEGTAASEGYGVIFENLAFDGFSPDEVDWLLDLTDEVSERYVGYRFRSAASLPQDFAPAVARGEFTVLSVALPSTEPRENPRYAW